MANEATLMFETHPAIPMTVNDSNPIEKGAALALKDPLTISGAFTAVPDDVAGIAASEKIASDGKVKLGVYRGGIFKVTLSGTCTVGDPAALATENKFYALDDHNVSGSVIAGIFLETGTNGETVYMELKPQPSGGQD